MYVIKGGCGTRQLPGFHMSRPDGLNNPVLLIVRTHGDYTVGGVEFPMEPGDAIVIRENTPYQYHNPQGEYIDDWMHIGLEPGEQLPRSLSLNVPIHLTDRESCTGLMRMLLWEASFTDETYKSQNINALFTVLLNHLIAASNREDQFDEGAPYRESLNNIRFQMQHFLSEEQSIRIHAGELGISESHFQHLYTAQFGIPFQQDLIRMRIANAEFALQATELSMAQIAEMCGYKSETHFFRQFKQITGITPAKYRKQQYAVTKH